MGFGVWRGGRHLASARWTDVVRVRALGRESELTGRLRIALQLRDGSEVLVHEELPGFELFLAAAEAKLEGMPGSGTWMAAIQPAVTRKETVLFERDARKR
jgi:hypothetical protein